ncbi:hypothetical protein HHK36_030340 [Tetracentron sinense]|uniref:Pentatricopeptide repeat-containing protein n=1 Tax=Tetracentron sinense TaxID=13715 RepID=A0A834Y9G7_TETSI|nr:hypothetical protein HHK36_030340 [Tetracentron sinense]
MRGLIGMNYILLLQACIKKRHSSAISIRFPLDMQALSLFSTFFTCKLTKRAENKTLDKALKILDLINPKITVTESSGNHLRLIQDLLRAEGEQCHKEQSSNDFVRSNSTEATPIALDGSLESDISWTNELNKEDEVLMILGIYRVGIRGDVNTLSRAVSYCGAARALELGIQLHCVAIRTGFDSYVYVGSSLICLYGKCGKLDNAYRVFEEMPVRNVVSWTTIIAVLAQYWKVDACLELYHRMRISTFEPNDFTFTSLLSACTGSGSLCQGRSTHCQTIQMGFVSHIHIANSLISMYSKCGNVQDAFYIFENMPSRDPISWNSMIYGYAQHGLAELAINLLKEMKKQKVKPDAITFLGVLSSCRHVGLVEQGRLCFNSMLEHGVKPELDHYSCIVDLLGRAGLLEEAREFIEKMPIYPNAIIWGSLLSSCRLHGNVWIGIQAAESRLLLEPGCAATHVQLANLYASVGCWDQAARVRKHMKDKGLKTNPGYSWIEIRNVVHRFGAKDISNSRVNDIIVVIDSLVDHMKCSGYVPKIHEGIDHDLYTAV